ncbi:TetR family transcriptional regulator [Pseudomonas sp. ZM23]|uniref:TetR family transcriptional regulator n=1 Tax=Pseudomonas triclosanedens TaxID=2961893 RepID=A0ABY7A2D5_9PSED|nr:TetR family transcriptional regulator [Pseudomonas triclosanedens]MCP8464062.1 TetR family transcriptional regulator [Pseudomonas triclosanedens]MCP8469146.1 TetR family transcriptional regulator [Pseudomonas triclosanedens]MCP8475868.1 TetR family transcriptional regulator [Pseudomonas triclosanedens]WAI50430.1 TetR family transcriptional regulator [Pseudomonas triclosanedens]
MVYRQTEARVQKDGELRERILKLALGRVADAGFAALTMQTLADDAGIATGSLYRHFRGKGELAAEVFSRASQREVDALAEVLATPASATARLSDGLRQFAARAWDSRQLAFALIAEPVDPEVDEQRLVYREAYAALFVQLLEQGIAHGEFPSQPVHLIAACLVGAIAEALVGPLSPPARAGRDAGLSNPSLEDVSDALVHFCLRAVGAPLPVPEDQP